VVVVEPLYRIRIVCAHGQTRDSAVREGTSEPRLPDA
jgi:hypothetical protein